MHITRLQRGSLASLIHCIKMMGKRIVKYGCATLQEQVYLKVKLKKNGVLGKIISFQGQTEVKWNNDRKTGRLHVATLTTSPNVPLANINLKINVVSLY